MKLNRREFLLLTVGLAAGCQADGGGQRAEDGGRHGGTAATHSPRIIDAGPVNHYASDGVYSNFRDQGFFIIRRGDALFALSAICTHRKCKLNLQKNQSFFCPCHGSTFDAAGHVTEGPARRDLPILPSHTNEQGQLVVSVL